MRVGRCFSTADVVVKNPELVGRVHRKAPASLDPLGDGAIAPHGAEFEITVWRLEWRLKYPGVLRRGERHLRESGILVRDVRRGKLRAGEAQHDVVVTNHPVGDPPVTDHVVEKDVQVSDTDDFAREVRAGVRKSVRICHPPRQRVLHILGMLAKLLRNGRGRLHEVVHQFDCRVSEVPPHAVVVLGLAVWPRRVAVLHDQMDERDLRRHALVPWKAVFSHCR